MKLYILNLYTNIAISQYLKEGKKLMAKPTVKKHHKIQRKSKKKHQH